MALSFDPTTTQELVSRIRQGDANAFDALFAEYGVALCSYAWRWTQSKDTAEELVQDVFLNIWTNRHTLDVRGPISTYLFRAVRNRALNHIRHERIERRFRDRPDLDEIPVGYSLANNADEPVALTELRDAVQEALGTLPERSREIFLLNREQGLTYADIAQVLDISVKTVEYHMGRAFAILRNRLAEWSPNPA